MQEEYHASRLGGKLKEFFILLTMEGLAATIPSR